MFACACPHRPLLRRRVVLRSLAAVSVSLGWPLTGLSVSVAPSGPPWQARSEAGLYQVQLGPQRFPVPIGRFQRWQLTLSNRDGDLVREARLAVTGGMPTHGHGLPSAPQITGPDAEGRWLIEGLRFNMPGQWQLQIGIDGPDGTDLARFMLQLDP